MLIVLLLLLHHHDIVELIGSWVELRVRLRVMEGAGRAVLLQHHGTGTTTPGGIEHAAMLMLLLHILRVGCVWIGGDGLHLLERERRSSGTHAHAHCHVGRGTRRPGPTVASRHLQLLHGRGSCRCLRGHVMV